MSQSTIQILLIEDDPIFRFGIRAVCADANHFEIVAEAETRAAATKVLQGWTADSPHPQNSPLNPVRVIVLEPGIQDLSAPLRSSEGQRFNSKAQLVIAPEAISFCQFLETHYSQFPILILTALQDPVLLTTIQDIGIEGYCPKGVSAEELAIALYQVASGEFYWVTPLPTSTTSPHPSAKFPALSQPLKKLRQAVGQSGLRQIDSALEAVKTELPDPKAFDRRNPAEILNWLIVRGQQRELLVARWMVSQLLPTSARSESMTPENGSETPLGNPSERFSESNSWESNRDSNPLESLNPEISQTLSSAGALASLKTTVLAVQPVISPNMLKSALFDATVAKLQSGLANQTGIPLETDILRPSQKRELIYLVLRQFEHCLDELQFSQIHSDQIPENCLEMLRDIWVATLTDFFGKYSTVNLGDRIVAIVPILLEAEPRVDQEILSKIPLISDLVAHLLFQTPLMVDNLACTVGSPDAMRQAEILLQNLVIRVANSVIQPLLNAFGDVEEIKQKFYDRRLLSTREIERFRNDLSWHYRVEQFFGEPQAIFESSYKLFVLSDRGIQTETIYSPRHAELMQLNGISLAVTLALETRDAIAPRIRSTLSLLGSGVVYLLTQVIGRGIGLIGRGVLQGIGSSIQETQIRNRTRTKGNRR
ncbi:MAG: DUF3685 domain-containing protein [Microcoleaceae cyanobacterium]